MKYHYDDNYYGFRYYNFCFISNDVENPISFFYAVEFDYYKIVDCYKNIKELKINQNIISIAYLNKISMRFLKKFIFDFNDISN